MKTAKERVALIGALLKQQGYELHAEAIETIETATACTLIARTCEEESCAAFLKGLSSNPIYANFAYPEEDTPTNAKGGTS